MRVSVQKWGNTLALRIPKAFAEDAAIREGSATSTWSTPDSGRSTATTGVPRPSSAPTLVDSPDGESTTPATRSSTAMSRYRRSLSRFSSEFRTSFILN